MAFGPVIIDPTYTRESGGGRPPQVLEIPSVYNTPTKEEVFQRSTGQGSGDDCCPCPKSGKQGQTPRTRQNPYGNPHQMPSPPGLDQPDMPQKPFQPMGQDPCASAAEALRGLGIDPDCLRELMGRGRSAPRRSARTRRPSRGRNNPKARSARARTRQPRAKKPRRAPSRSRRTPGSLGYRTTKNGACYDVARGRFVSKRYCQ